MNEIIKAHVVYNLQEQSEQPKGTAAPSNGYLKAIFTLAGLNSDFDVYVWPSTDEHDAKLRRAAAYARGSLFFEGAYLVTWRDNPQFKKISDLYTRMKKLAHSCLEESACEKEHHRASAYELIAACARDFGDEYWKPVKWEDTVLTIDGHVKLLGCDGVIPGTKFEHLDLKTDDQGYASLDLIYSRIKECNFLCKDKKPHLTLVRS